MFRGTVAHYSQTVTDAEAGRRHTRDDVARTALHILDEYGLAGFTMRRLAGALHVQPGALYWHFPDKQTLLAELADRILAQAASAAPGEAWPATLRFEAVAVREALLAHRDGAEVVASTLALGLGSTAVVDRLAEAIRIGRFDSSTAQRAAAALLHFILGHVSHEQQRVQYDSFGVVAGTHSLQGDDPTTDFIFGVDLLIGGLELRQTRV